MQAWHVAAMPDDPKSKEMLDQKGLSTKVLLVLICTCMVAVLLIAYYAFKSGTSQTAITKTEKVDTESDELPPLPTNKKEEEAAEQRARQIRVAAAKSTIRNYEEQKRRLANAGGGRASLEQAVARRLRTQGLYPDGVVGNAVRLKPPMELQVDLQVMREKYGRVHPYAIQTAIDLALSMETRDDDSSKIAAETATDWRQFVAESAPSANGKSNNSKLQALIDSIGLVNVCTWAEESGETLALLLAGHRLSKDADLLALDRVLILDKLSYLSLRDRQIQIARNRVLAAAPIIKALAEVKDLQSNKKDLEKMLRTHLSSLASVCTDDPSLEGPYSEMMYCKKLLAQSQGSALTVPELHAKLGPEQITLDFYQFGVSPIGPAPQTLPPNYGVVIATGRDLRWIDLGPCSMLDATIKAHLSNAGDLSKSSLEKSLCAPIRKMVGAEAKKIWIVDDGKFAQLPWAKLFNTVSSKTQIEFSTIKSPEELLKKSGK